MTKPLNSSSGSLVSGSLLAAAEQLTSNGSSIATCHG
jgi:hypothetical protein